MLKELPEQIKQIANNEAWAENKVNFFLECVNIALENSESEKTAIANALEQAHQFTNAMKSPKVYYCSHMEAGVAGYGDFKVLINSNTMKKMSPSFQGKPIFIGHKSLEETALHKDKPEGYVVDTFYNELDGKLWSKILITTDAGHAAAERGMQVSNAYVPKSYGVSGRHIGVDFDKEIVEAEFTHLAFTDTPRYKNSKVYTVDKFKEHQALLKKELEQLQNSEEKKGAKMSFKLFNKKTEEVKSLSELSDETIIQLENGEELSLKTMKETVEAKIEAEKAAAIKASEQVVNEDQEIEVAGEKITIKALKEKFEAIKAEQLANSEAEAKAAEEAEKAKAEKTKQLANSENFKKLADAGKEKQETIVVTTSADRAAKGKQKYGTSK